MLWQVTFPGKQTRKFCGPEVFLGVVLGCLLLGEEGWGGKGRWALVQSKYKPQLTPQGALELNGLQKGL